MEEVFARGLSTVPSLVGEVISGFDNVDMGCRKLDVLGRDGKELVRHFITFYRHNFTFYAVVGKSI